MVKPINVSGKFVFVGGAVLFVGIIVIGLNLPHSAGSTPQTTTAPEHVGIGQQGVISASTTVAVSKDAYDAYQKTLVGNDAVGFYQLKEQGLIYLLPADAKVQVIGSTWGDDQVRFMEGADAGKTGWVGYEDPRPL